LDAAGRDWKVYYHDVATVMTFSRVLARPNLEQHFARFDQFEEDVRGEKLPAYCFIEPRVFDDPVNGIYSNDQHPPHDVRRGEALLARIYEALRSSQHWESSLLVVLYDEHGGYYDHVPPPWVRTNTSTVPSGGFDFSILGPRVPAVFVSPLLQRRRPPVRPRSNSQYFTHESIILTLAKMWNLDATMLEWQHDPAQIATFEWLWQEEGHTAADWPKEEIRLPDWRQLEAVSTAFAYEGMDPYECNYEVGWVGWAVESARFLMHDIFVEDPEILKWCETITKLLPQTLSSGPFMDGFCKVIEQTKQRLSSMDNQSKQILKSAVSSELQLVVAHLDSVISGPAKTI